MADFEKVINDSFTQYAGAVIQSRALVDVRDCLKPSARQIFYCMETDGFNADKPFKKTLKSIGSAMRTYIHGDASCEGIIMRAAQPFAMRYPLVEVEGSYGNPMETENWAAPRYTSARLAPITQHLFADLKKDTISDWRDNYDDTEQYPAVLPSKGFYNLVNGTQGIGVGIASSIPQFNLIELNRALITLLNNPEATFEELYCAPDFATGGMIINEEAIKESLRIGSGKACIIRAKIEYNKKDNTLTVTEIPFNVYTNTICKELEVIVNGDENPGIVRFNDLTGLTPCIKIYLEKNIKPDYIINYLYCNTSLQSSYSINMTMLDMGKYPKVFGWKEILQNHLNHEEEVYTRGFEFDKKKIGHRIKILSGIIKAISKIEEVIEIIKNSNSTNEANQNLQKLLTIDSEQAQAILEIKLSRIAKLEIDKYEKELNELERELERITAILNSKELLKQEMINNFKLVSKKFGDERRTIVTNITIQKEDKEIANIEPEECVVILTASGLIKRIPNSAFKTQKRNGKGVKSADDIVSCIIRTNTIDSLLIFGSTGSVYRLLVDDIPIGTNSSQGVPISALVSLSPNETPSTIYSLYRDTDAKYVLFITRSGIIKKTELEEYKNIRKKTGTKAINLREGDELASVNLIKDEEIIMVTNKGQVLRTNTDTINPIGRTAAGVKGINLNEGDEVIAAWPIRNRNDDLAIFTEGGNGKRVSLSEFNCQNRGGKGVKCISGNHTIADAALVEDGDTLLIAGTPSSICIEAKDINNCSRLAVGVSVIKGSKISSVSKI